MAKAVASANYKFALFDKRLAIYDELDQIVGQIVTATWGDDLHSRIKKATLAAKSLFNDDKEIVLWVTKLDQSAQSYWETKLRIKKLDDEIAAGTAAKTAASEKLEEHKTLVTQYLHMAHVCDVHELELLFNRYLTLESVLRFETENS
ncbi:hypothetical protein FY134_03040 [Agrobacterium fabrum]|uniref:hypothetical protein n=1 Tax=Agrobacterium fabrum TaxID=1176649 RepID=UPI0021D361A6|nr:hypothetical protein [Agrobacterium fabrum]UXT56674.1 hypothetical protein FY134_03040 [Agrobacterium fabrum]